MFPLGNTMPEPLAAAPGHPGPTGAGVLKQSQKLLAVYLHDRTAQLTF